MTNFEDGGVEALDSVSAWEGPSMVHKHVADQLGKKRRRRKRKVSPSYVEKSAASIKVTLEAQTKSMKWVSLERRVTVDALMQSVGCEVLAASLVNGMHSKVLDAIYAEGDAPTMQICVTCEVGRHVRGFRCADDAIVWLGAIVIGARHYASGID